MINKNKTLSNFKNLYFSNKNHFKLTNLPYWLKSYTQKLNLEINNELPSYYRKFKQGDVVMVDFGVNVGSEMSGGHFAIIMDKKDSQYNRVVTLIPLTSKKHKNIGNISLGNELVNNTKILIENKISSLNLDMDQNAKQMDLVVSQMKEALRYLLKISSGENKDIVNNIASIQSDCFNENDEIEPRFKNENFLETSIKYLKTIDGLEHNDELSKLFVLFQKELETSKKVNIDHQSIINKISGLEKLNSQFKKYSNETFVNLQNINTVSKLRIKKFSEYDISSNVNIGSESIDTIKDAISRKFGI